MLLNNMAMSESASVRLSSACMKARLRN